MNPLSFSQHAVARMNQRGLRKSDVELVIQCGSELGDDVYFLSRKDVEREIHRRKKEIQALERLREQKLVVAQNTVVTAYRSRRGDQKAMLRQQRAGS